MLQTTRKEPNFLCYFYSSSGVQKQKQTNRNKNRKLKLLLLYALPAINKKLGKN